MVEPSRLDMAIASVITSAAFAAVVIGLLIRVRQDNGDVALSPRIMESL